MAISATELARIFDGSVSRQIQEALVRCVFGSYRTAHDECSGFPGEEAHDLLPYYRWIQLRSDLRGMTNRFDGVHASAERYHTLLHVGRILLTAQRVDGPEGLVRPSVYRLAYAASSQLELFEQNTPPPDDALFYAILLHGPDPREAKQPLFAQIAFPDKTLQSYVHKIDLFSRFEPVIDSLRIAHEEGGGQDVTIQLRKAAKKQNVS
ncbi:MAG: hypothetical protein F9K13_02680 [Candidatus Methylomirabilis oxygeniifera]|uniref:Uncharacterized protein n=1 Tax=Methylomirabilis oxygeniifera TaxID=671143 RepID=D5MF66_METO1|nr:MAG: hypothetical protein F9K13_02680 [Candidatus Methylomirabilis oxyfera]CBE68395.1 protein of unknown function [Candidatus Methylomirabilis oxyfera]